MTCCSEGNRFLILRLTSRQTSVHTRLAYRANVRRISTPPSPHIQSHSPSKSYEGGLRVVAPDVARDEDEELVWPSDTVQLVPPPRHAQSHGSCQEWKTERKEPVGDDLAYVEAQQELDRNEPIAFLWK